MNENKDRLDNILLIKGLAESREKAKAQIMAGLVFVEGIKIDKPGTRLDIDSNIVLKGNAIPYVSRGGLKLEKAINSFDIKLNDTIAVDIGASTGGFTDCMLQNGAKKVYCIDVGYGQLAWKLRSDDRVVCMERTNIRYVKPEDLDEVPQFASIDVSFISLTKVLPPVGKLLSDDGKIVALIKPQFEAGKEKVGKKGVVKDKTVHIEVIKKIVDFILQEIQMSIIGLTYSPVKGPEGNIEYLLYISNINNVANCINIEKCDELIQNIVEQAHNNLK